MEGRLFDDRGERADWKGGERVEEEDDDDETAN